MKLMLGLRGKEERELGGGGQGERERGWEEGRKKEEREREGENENENETDWLMLATLGETEYGDYITMPKWGRMKKKV